MSLFHYANLSNPSILYHGGLLHMKWWDWEDCIGKPDQAIFLHESNTISKQTNGMHGPKRNNAKADQCRIMGAMPSYQSNAPVPELYPCQSVPIVELIDKNDHANEKCYLKLLLLITFMLLKLIDKKEQQHQHIAMFPTNCSWMPVAAMQSWIALFLFQLYQLQKMLEKLMH